MKEKYKSLISEYVNTEVPLIEILSRKEFQNDKFAKVVLSYTISENAAKEIQIETDAESEAEEYDQDYSAPHIKLIFYTAWGAKHAVNNNLELARYIIKRGIQQCPKDTHPLLLSSARVVLAYAEGGRSKFISQLEVEINQDNNHSVGYNRLIKRYLNMISGEGKAWSEVNSVNQILKYKKRLSNSFITKVNYSNNVETCNFEELKEVRYQRLNTSFYSDLYYVLLNRSRPNKFSEISRISKSVIISTEMLFNQKPAEALLELKKNDLNILVHSSSNFERYALIRAELCNHNLEAAIQLMKINLESGDTHYIDNLFFARIELLRGRRSKALFYFKETYRMCDQHNALNRLQIELDLSLECKPGDIFFLTKQIFLSKDIIDGPPDNQILSSSIEQIGIRRIIGKSEVISNIKSNVLKISKSSHSVLITGETGVGKEILARAIHEESDRKDKPFLAINCGAISESLLQSELFGHHQGAFTGATIANKGIFIDAGHGTVLLDEIGTISPSIQIALLRVLENKEVRPIGGSKQIPFNCRILAATNEDLMELVKKKLFREDLFYRLNMVEIIIPPLRNRRLDILEIAYYFFKNLRKSSNTPVLSKELETHLIEYSWPGNIRQLKNEIEKMDLFHSRKSNYSLKDCDLFIKHLDENQIHTNPTEIEPLLNIESDKKKILPWRRLDLIKKMFVENQDLTRQEIANHMNICLSTATQDLKILIEEDYIEKITPTKSPRTHYFVKK